MNCLYFAIGLRGFNEIQEFIEFAFLVLSIVEKRRPIEKNSTHAHVRGIQGDRTRRLLFHRNVHNELANLEIYVARHHYRHTINY